jgi:hypothetical protein
MVINLFFILNKMAGEPLVAPEVEVPEVEVPVEQPKG